ASGVWIGSAFLASEEAGILPGQKQAIVDATEEGTVVSRSVTGKPARIIKSKWTQLWAESEHEPLPMPYQTQVSRPALIAANLAGREQEINPGFAGQGIGMIKAVRPAAEIMADFVAGADATLKARLSLLNG
ncbi:MAG: nitronate monooxygenase, partial [Alphaproteobacteria bacterium]